jgi:MFS family permease
MARYGTLVGPKFYDILQAGPALVLQEFGNIATAIIGVPIAIYLGLKREAVGAAHSIAREPNVALIGDVYGLDTPEGRGVMGVYICGTVFGTIFFGLLASFLAAFQVFHPYALAMASGVGSASMMTAAVGTLSATYPSMAEQIQAFGVASNTLSGVDGVYMSLILALPISNKLYKIIYKLKYKTSEGEA